jgi:hypothetical protein
MQAIMRLQHSMKASCMAGSIGIMVQVMPSAVMVQVIRHIIIGIGIIIGMPWGIMPIGIMPIWAPGIMPPIGMAPCIGIGMGMGMGICIIMGICIGVAAVIGVVLGLVRWRGATARSRRGQRRIARRHRFPPSAWRHCATSRTNRLQ